MTRVQLAIMEGLSRLGDPYFMKGLEGKPLLTGRTKTDCSGLIQVMVAVAGVNHLLKGGKSKTIRAWAGSVTQFDWSREISVKYALSKQGIGCLLFIKPKGNKAGHVAFSLGSGYTLEARGSEGVCIVKPDINKKRSWDRAAKVDALFEKLAA